MGRYWTSTEVGLYAIAFGVPTMAMSLMSGGIGPVLFPAVSELFARNDQGNVKTIYLTSARYLMFLTLPLCAIGIALAGPLVRLLYGGDYAPAVVPMQIIFVAMAVFAVLPSAHAVLNGIDRPDLVLKVGLATAPLSVGLSLMLIPSYGVLGAAVGSSIPQLLSFFLTTWLVRRQLHVWWPWLDTIKVGAVSAVVALSMLQIQGLVPGTGGAAISLVAGIAIYLTGIVAARALRQEDLLMLKTLVPPVLRAKYVSFLGLAVRVVKT